MTHPGEKQARDHALQAEIIAIGTELTSGAKLDTNSQWLSIELAAVGIPVHYHTTMADELPAMVRVLRAAVERSDIVLVTGGLGPTLDDLTRHALAELTRTELELHAPSLEFIKDLFARRKRPMPERNIIQAMFPAGSRPLANPRGTAPGIWLEVPRPGATAPCQIAAMPGVPSEMKRMFQEEVLPLLPAGQMVIRRARVNCFGVGESHAEEMLGDVTARGRDPEVGITVHEATITLRIAAHGRSGLECDEKIASTKAIIRERMERYVFGEEDDELEHIVVRLLNDGGWTLATVESGTGGLLAERLADVDGHQTCYRGGLTLPNDRVQQQVLNLTPQLFQDSGSISSAAARAMSKACRNLFQTDFALAVTDCPPFDPDDTQAHSPSLFVALATSDGERVQELTLLGDTSLTKSRTAKTALDLLRRELLDAT